ncbi:hypothetical protein CRV24_006128 [Beauveria bassiana]|nr:hypothetical protein CRV24_006128 [Beauveria bassiana]KAH8708886.1 hypothetical protein HC256_008819 [Beauveria bassiana]
MPLYKFCVVFGALATAVARATGEHAQVVLSTDESPVQQQHPLIPLDRKALEEVCEWFDDFIRIMPVKPSAADVILVQELEQGAASPEDENDSDPALDSVVVDLVGQDKHKKYYNRLKAQYDAIMRSKEEEEQAKDDPCD